MTGLLTDSAVLDFADHVNVDRITLDYSILAHVDYKYPAANAYFTSATKGCGMRCGFCAVQTLEPQYNPYISISEQIREVEQKYGTRRNLMLMDNNILLSSCFDQIIEDIRSLGFGVGDKWRNPETGKLNQRHVDINQGLDANHLTPDKAAQLASISLLTTRIAFDHIDDESKYLKAMETTENAGLHKLSNYLLYNTPQFTGKGKPRRADTPDDLWNRIRINVEFAEQMDKKHTLQGLSKFESYSYPMKYAPLTAKDRTFIGDNWTREILGSVSEMLSASKGVVYSRRPYFEAVWGATLGEFHSRLMMPRKQLAQFTRECLSRK